MAFTAPNPFDRQQKMEGVKNILVVGAGKGGVGKSTVAVNLAVSLQKAGKTVGLLDADIYGPSIPKMMGLSKLQPNINADKKIEPLIAFGIKTMSIGYLVDDKSAIIWRGPMLFKAIDQFIRDVAWGELDYLVIDLPPGTGDVQLSIVQKVPVTGAVIVSTPQDMALIDVRRCVDMFQRVKTPILGLVENMSTFVCPHCKHETDLFPAGELHQYSAELKIPVLAQIPFNPVIAVAGERGTPFAQDGASARADIEQTAFAKAAQSLIEKIEAPAS